VNLAPGLAGIPLAPLVADRVGLPTYLDLHPRSQALGDRWFGQGRGVSSFASVYTGEAIGVGLVLDGMVHRGPAGAGGEIGHSIVQVGGAECRCGQRGCWETIATHPWLRAEAARLQLPSARTITAGRLARLAAKDHPGAADLFDRYAANLAVGITNLQQILAPGLFILHGDAAAGGEAFRSAIEGHVRAYMPAHPGGSARIAFAPPDDHATLLGAAALVLSHSLQLDV
jgi:predicted NBD/HSP70 family sugar kinase